MGRLTPSTDSSKGVQPSLRAFKSLRTIERKTTSGGGQPAAQSPVFLPTVPRPLKTLSRLQEGKRARWAPSKHNHTPPPHPPQFKWTAAVVISKTRRWLVSQPFRSVRVQKHRTEEAHFSVRHTSCRSCSIPAPFLSPTASSFSLAFPHISRTENSKRSRSPPRQSHQALETASIPVQARSRYGGIA